MPFSGFLDHLSVALLLSGTAYSATVPPPRNDGIHLAVSPKCGSFNGAPADVNAGLFPLQAYKTLVTFGDSYTDGGIRNGSALLPPVVIPPRPEAGGRATNGPVWAEDIVADTGALLKDYAFGGAVTDQSLWPSKANHSDFIGQVQIFLNQSNKLDPQTTLYSSFFGINDVGASLIDGTANLPKAAQTIIDQITLLTKPPTNARHFLVIEDYSRGKPTTAGEAWKQQYFTGLNTLRRTIPGFRVAFVDLKTIWEGVVGVQSVDGVSVDGVSGAGVNGTKPADPGFEAFGYTSSGACTVSDQTTVGACADPEHTFYWIPGHPSKETHRIMADYIEEALVQCRVL